MAGRHKTIGRRRQYNKFGMMMVSIVVLMIMVVVAVGSKDLKDKIRAVDGRMADIQAKIDEETARSEEIEEFGKYTQTKKYKEEVAKEKLGLVYEDEILFQQED